MGGRGIDNFIRLERSNILLGKVEVVVELVVEVVVEVMTTLLVETDEQTGC